MLTADHGESLGADGSIGHASRRNDAQLHVPLVICSDRLPPGTRSDVAGSADLAGTILAMAGFGGRSPGRDLVDAGGQAGALGYLE